MLTWPKSTGRTKRYCFADLDGGHLDPDTAADACVAMINENRTALDVACAHFERVLDEAQL